jgi:hypothetical protein
MAQQKGSLISVYAVPGGETISFQPCAQLIELMDVDVFNPSLAAPESFDLSACSLKVERRGKQLPTLNFAIPQHGPMKSLNGNVRAVNDTADM